MTAIPRIGLPVARTRSDDGCDAAPSCISCPFVACRYDYPGGLRALKRIERNR